MRELPVVVQVILVLGCFSADGLSGEVPRKGGKRSYTRGIDGRSYPTGWRNEKGKAPKSAAFLRSPKIAEFFSVSYFKRECMNRDMPKFMGLFRKRKKRPKTVS